MNKKMLFLVVMLLCVVFALTACFGKETTTTTTVAEQTTTVAEVKTTTVAEVKTTTVTEQPTTAPVEEPKTRTIVDMSGREVEIPMEVKTIINSWPSSNSVMLMIGAGDYLVGTSTATVNNKWNQFMYPNLVNIPTDISNTEDILKYEPDLYICNNADTADKITAAGVPAVNLTFSNYESMKKSFTILGEILGGEYVTKMAKWCEFVDEWTQTITTRLADVAEEDKPILYYISSQSNAELTATFASPSICQDWATICGTIYLNDLTSEPSASTITMEEILDINPDIIINGGIQQAASWEALQSSELMAEVNAMKNGRAYLAPMGMHSFARFGIEAALMLPWTASTVWPEKFQDVDMRQLCYDFYKEFSGVELTDAQIENLLIGYAPDDPYGATAAANNAAGGTDQPAEGATRTIVDMEGRTVEIPAKVERIVNNWPSSNSVMLMIGAGDLLVGTTTTTVNNEWNKFMYPNLVNVPTDINNVEDVLKLEPDLYISSGVEKAEEMQKAGIPAVCLMFSDYDNMKKSFTILGEILGGDYVKKMEYWCDFVDEWKSTITTRLADLKEEEKPVLYYCAPMGNGELTTTFKSPSMCQDWANICGTVYLNDLTDNPGAGTITTEEILKIDPDIIVIGGLYQADALKNLQESVLWQEVKAVKEGRVYVAPKGMHPIPRFGIEGALMLPWTAATLWPDKFADVDLDKIFHDFYFDLSGVDLTDAQVKNLLAGFNPDDPYGATAVGK